MIKRFHLLGDRYLFDDYESGFYLDLQPVSRNPGDEDALNGRIDDRNDSLVENDPPNQNFACTVFLNEAQYKAMKPKYPVQFGAKSYLLLFVNSFNGKEIPKNPWFDQGGGGMICHVTGSDKSKWVYYTDWNANSLRHRFKMVSKQVVDEYLKSIGQTAPVDDPDDDPVVTPPVNPVSGGLTIHLVCPHCNKVIF